MVLDFRWEVSEGGEVDEQYLGCRLGMKSVGSRKGRLGGEEGARPVTGAQGA